MNKETFNRMNRRLDHLQQRAETAALLLGMARVQLARQAEEIRGAKTEILQLLQRPPSGADPGKAG